MITQTSEGLWEDFQSLSHPPDSGEIPVYTTGVAFNGYRIARNVEGQPCFLIEAAGEGSLVAPRLQHLRILPNARCELKGKDGELTTRRLTVLEPVDVEHRLARFLVNVYLTVALEAGPRPSPEKVQVLLGKVADLFRRLGTTPRTTAQGLWTELFLISSSEDALLTARAWHDDFGDRWDFADGMLRLEAKSSGSTGDRRHHFTHAQLCPAEELEVWIVSLWAVRGESAVTIGQLLDQLRDRLRGSPDLISRIERIVVSAAGEAASEMFSEAFEPSVAAASAQLVSARDVPKPTCEQSPGVMRVEFLSDVSFGRTMSPSKLMHREDLIGGMCRGLVSVSSGGDARDG